MTVLLSTDDRGFGGGHGSRDMAADVDDALEELFESMPIMRTLGLASADIEDGTAEFHVPVDDDLTNHRVVHGGVTATLMDATVAASVLSEAEATLDDMMPLTIATNVNYIAPIPDGEIVARAELVNYGRRIALGRSDVFNDGTHVATGFANYYQRWSKD